MNIKIHKGFWTRDQVARDVDSVYVFGDNAYDAISLHVPKSTQACVRALPNVRGITTKRDRHWNDSSFLSNDDLPVFIVLLEAAIELIKIDSAKGKTICFPSDGIGTGKAMLHEKAPMCWEYLCKRLKEEFDYDNGQNE